MKVFKLIIRNALRHRLRTFLTVLGLALAVMAFGLIRTLVDAWYAGARVAPPELILMIQPPCPCCAMIRAARCEQ